LQIENAIQVSLSLSDKKGKDREIQGLRDAMEELRTKQLTILTEDEEGSDSINGAEITILPLYKWLLLYSEGN